MKKILLVYKNSHKIFQNDQMSHLIQRHQKQVQESKKEEKESISIVKDILEKENIDYEEKTMEETFNEKDYELVLTLGGDGTFLKTAQNINNKIVIGINTALDYSVGYFCSGNKNNFYRIIKQYKNKELKTKKIPRIEFQYQGDNKKYYFINDILISNNNPGRMSRYIIEVNNQIEEQKGSGIWISSALGSSAAIISAGGQRINKKEKLYQYKPRELYYGKSNIYQLVGGILQSENKIRIVSLMKKGMIYMDGAYKQYPFTYGMEIEVGMEDNYINTIEVEK